MNILEKEIEDIIFEGIMQDPSLMTEKGFSIDYNKQYLRQFDLGPYGRLDIFGYFIGERKKGIRSIYAHVIEIKKDEISIETFLQALRYNKGLEILARQQFKRINYKSRITLVGKTVDTNGDFIFLPDFTNIDLLTYSIDFADGIKFQKHNNYHIDNDCNLSPGNIPDFIRSNIFTRRNPNCWKPLYQNYV